MTFRRWTPDSVEIQKLFQLNIRYINIKYFNTNLETFLGTVMGHGYDCRKDKVTIIEG